MKIPTQWKPVRLHRCAVFAGHTCKGTTFALLSFLHHSERRFCLMFYFKWKYFVLTDNVLSKTICLFCFCVLFSNIYPKIKFTAKNWSGLCIFYGKVIFWHFCFRKYFKLFFAEVELLKFTIKMRKFQKIWTSEICLKCLFVCLCWVLRPSQPNGVMSSAVSLPNHTFTGQA